MSSQQPKLSINNVFIIDVHIQVQYIMLIKKAVCFHRAALYTRQKTHRNLKITPSFLFLLLVR